MLQALLYCMICGHKQTLSGLSSQFQEQRQV